MGGHLRGFAVASPGLPMSGFQPRITGLRV